MIKHALITVILLAATSLAGADSGLQVSEPWVREAPPTSRVLAAYLTLVNTGDNTVTVTAISSPDFKNAEIHRTVIEAGVARMLPVKQLEVPAGVCSCTPICNQFIKKTDGVLIGLQCQRIIFC